MKQAALELPGGQVSLDQAVELEEMLDAETEKRRCVLSQGWVNYTYSQGTAASIHKLENGYGGKDGSGRRD